MAKVKLGSRPTTFKKVVSFEDINGEKLSIEWTYNYRTRTEFGDWLESLFEKANAEAQARLQVDPAAEGATADGAATELPRFSMATFMRSATQNATQYLMEAASGWNLDIDFTRENVQKFCDEYPGGATESQEGYRTACAEGRLGN